MSSQQTSIVINLCEVCWLYTQVHNFTERQAGDVSYGLVRHSFMTALREELTEYYRLLAALEHNVREGTVTLLQLGIWTRQPITRLRLLVGIVNSVRIIRGRALATQRYSFLSQRDPELRGCVATWLPCCRPAAGRSTPCCSVGSLMVVWRTLTMSSLSVGSQKCREGHLAPKLLH